MFDGLVNFLEICFIDQLLDAANGDVWHKILTVTEITDTVESIEDVFFQIVKCFRFLAHAKPKHTRRMVTAKNARAVEVHGEWLMVFRHFLAGFYDFRDIGIGRVADKFQGQVNLVGLAPVDVAFFVLQVALQAFRQGGKLRSAVDGNG